MRQELPVSLNQDLFRDLPVSGRAWSPSSPRAEASPSTSAPAPAPLAPSPAFTAARVSRLHETVLDQLSMVVLVVDEAVQVQYTNRAARELLTEGGPLLVRQGQLQVAGAEQQDLLRDLVARCRCTRRAQGAMLGARGARGAFWASVAPLYGDFDPRQRGPATLFLVQLTAPWRQLPWEFALVSQAFDLTVAEAQVVCALADGMSAEDYARQSRQAPAEVHALLRGALNKTGLRHQAELVQVIARIAPLAAITTPDCVSLLPEELRGGGLT